ncbi:family 20 glycosylhydrolase, partial [Streptomyces sp. SID5785]|uniref:family 20 glycosylhydrolase n=1 Tax=Streptomyces sp. SID5785 TaxID=2690309 RepID=UPI001361897C|nr:family 20 glycosylhydrolase [Streptomyces sp. SID5785]
MSAARPALVPQPTHVAHRPGRFTLDAGTRLRLSPGSEAAARLLRATVGLPFVPSPDGAFVVALDPQLAGLGEEGYGLTVAPDAVLLRAAAPTGLLRGVQTVRQLLAPGGLTGRPAAPLLLPCVEITDVPRHRWRGFMLDVARHFQPVSLLRRYVELLALHKINVLQLHLTDDQGWRLPVPGYPRLTEVGGRRAESMVGPAGSTVFDGVPHEGAYT